MKTYFASLTVTVHRRCGNEFATESDGPSQTSKSGGVAKGLGPQPVRPISKHMFTEVFAIQLASDFLTGKSIEELFGELRLPVVLVENRARGGIAAILHWVESFTMQQSRSVPFKLHRTFWFPKHWFRHWFRIVTIKTGNKLINTDDRVARYRFHKLTDGELAVRGGAPQFRGCGMDASLTNRGIDIQAIYVSADMIGLKAAALRQFKTADVFENPVSAPSGGLG
jgi:hypothetical protein